MSKKNAILCSVLLFTLIYIFIISAMFAIPDFMTDFIIPFIAGYATVSWIIKNTCIFYEWLRKW